MVESCLCRFRYIGLFESLGTPKLVQVSEIGGPNWFGGVRDPKTPLSATPAVKNVFMNGIEALSNYLISTQQLMKQSFTLFH